jgi:hypothetical protein
MHDVQIAIQDQAYAEALLQLLVSDGNHLVHIVDRPNTAIRGVVVVDEATLHLADWREEPNIERYLVLTYEPCDVDRLWEIGTRQVLPAHYEPAFIRVAVLAAELRLGGMWQTRRVSFTSCDRNNFAWHC